MPKLTQQISGITLFNRGHQTAIRLGLGAVLVLVSAQIATADDVEKGKELYNGIGACAGCHGALGKGDGPAGGALDPKPRDLSSGDYKFDTDGDGTAGTEADIANVIANGAQKYGGSMMMVARPDIDEAGRTAIAKYVLSLKGS